MKHRFGGHKKKPTKGQLTDRFSRSTKLTMNLAIVLYIFVVTLQGVNGKAYSDFKDKAENDTDIEEEPTFWGHDLELSPEVWIILVFSVVIFWILLAIFLTCFCGPNFVECQLCEQQVPRNQWTRVDHRENCAKDHERFLAGLKKITVRCPRCLARLRLWPKLGPLTFKCRAGLACPMLPTKTTTKNNRWKQRMRKVDAKDKELIDEEEATMMASSNLEPIEVENTGENRFTCFECDFNICGKCVEFIENETADTNNIDLGSQFMPMKGPKPVEKNRNVSEVSNGSVAWQKERPLVRTISREVEMRQMASNYRPPQRKSITQVRPQN